MLKKEFLIQEGIDENLLSFLEEISEEDYFLNRMKEYLKFEEEPIEAFDMLIEMYSRELSRFEKFIENADSEKMDLAFGYLLKNQIELYEKNFEI